ncbi:GTPase-activating protein CdGAPr isoform X3 [Nilaparvata lugens]|uniref:GTPase-activating protein CdGAPr isoform X3 n=1 Tax=Nilaparvata lugens TaxID=108931 RepID=UPI00193E472B|nr:GTPase-activating protein CdGAPr isoform X3 [Nilaparvata lugens]
MFVESRQPIIGRMAVVSGSRRSRGLTDILPQPGISVSYPNLKPLLLLQLVSSSASNRPFNISLSFSSFQEVPRNLEASNICSEGKPRIQHLTGASASPEPGKSRFPKLEECAHFHYEHVELGPLQVSVCRDEDLKQAASDGDSVIGGTAVTIRVVSAGQSWLLRRTYENCRMLDKQLHRCIYDRKFSQLPELPSTPPDNQESIEQVLDDYLARFSLIAGSLMNCGPVLSWLELDNRGHRLLVTDGDSCPINTPAVAAAYSIKKYQAIAADEISFDVGDMISVIDMPPPEESAWWRGKRGFLVGFFPSHCVAVITDKLPRNLNLNQTLALSGPTKPVLRKHGKLIAFFRAFILSRPSRRRLKQCGILKERVFGCDLGEHLLNSGHEIPMVLKCCAEFIEKHGLVDGIYRLSGVTSNIQRIRTTFDEDRIPALYEDEAILQDIHSVASLLKMYFRELPNPLCTYQLYNAFVAAVQTPVSPDASTDHRLLRMREVVHKLPPPHYRTLEYLMRHLARVSEKGPQTGMTARNIAIVWAPNLLRCKELEVGGVAALQGVGVQAVVTEFLIVYAELIFCSAPLPASVIPSQVTPKRSRPKSLAISTPTKLLSLEEAQSRALAAGRPDQDYIEVGGGPSCLPAKYHTVIELPRKRAGSKRSPIGWKSLFSKAGRHSGAAAVAGRKSRSPANAATSDARKTSMPSDLVFGNDKALTEADLAQGRRRLRPVKSAESLASASANQSARSSACLEPHSPAQAPPSPSPATAGHNRSVSHDSYFDTLADTPQHVAKANANANGGQLLHEEDEEDLSDLQVNFDLEESDMRIFSEDETNQLFSSQNSVEIHKRQPVLARCDDTLSSDPSPKKHKTGAAAPTNQNKRSRLEERFSSAQLRYIDSQSPEQTVQVDVEVHNSSKQQQQQSTSSPSLVEATVSENESVSVSGLTTPDTPRLIYTPLTEDSLSDAVHTPDYVPLSSQHSKLSPLPSPSHQSRPRDRLSYQGDVRARYENVPGDRHSFQDCVLTREESKYENVPFKKLQSTDFLDMNTPDSVSSGVKSDEVMYEKIKNEDASDIYEAVDNSPHTTHKSEKYYENVGIVDSGYEQVAKKEASSSYEEISDKECLLSESLLRGGISSTNLLAEEMKTENEYECLVASERAGADSTSAECFSDKRVAVPDSNHNVPSPSIGNEENFYEDIQSTSLPESIVYQQVKYLRRSVHEINQLLEESMEPYTGEDVSSLEEEETALISPTSNGVDDQPTSAGQPSQQLSSLKTHNDQTLSPFLSQSFIESESVNNVSSLNDESSVTPLVDSTNQHCSSTENLIDMDESMNSRSKPIPAEEMVSDTPYQSNYLSGAADNMSTTGDISTCEVMEISSNETQPKNSEASTLSNAELATTVSSSSSSSSHVHLAKHNSPTRNMVHSLDENRRKFESEIGRDILRERKMRQELKANSSSTGNCSSGSQNVQELLSRFEWSRPERSSIAPCLRAKLNRQNSKDSSASVPPTMTTSLDGNTFPHRSDEVSSAPPQQLARVKTSPDLNHNQQPTESKPDESTSASVDSESVRRERIEKYKEERRSYLRKKYRTDSFNNNDDNDELIRRIKQKVKSREEGCEESNLNSVGGCRESMDASEWKSRRREGGEDRLGSPELEMRLGSKNGENSTTVPIVRTTVSITCSPVKMKTATASRERSIKSESDACITVVAPLKTTVEKRPSPARHKSEELPSTFSIRKEERRSWRAEGDEEEASLVARRVSQLSTSADSSANSCQDEFAARRRTSLTESRKPIVSSSNSNSSLGRQRANSSSAKSSPYCIREMAAMFENREK